MKFLNKKILYIYYITCVAITMLVRFIFVKGENANYSMVLFGAFILITWVPGAIIFEKRNRHLVTKLKKIEGNNIYDILLFGNTGVLNTKGIFKYLFNNDDIENHEVWKLKIDTKNALIYMLFQFILFLPLGFIIVI